MLHGDQGIDLANARIDHVARAPILHYAVGMFRWRVGGCAAACSPGRSVVSNWPLELQPKRPSTQRTHNARVGRGKGFSHDGSPFDSVQYSANGHITCWILSSAAPIFTATLAQASLNVITICRIWAEFAGFGYFRAAQPDRRAGGRQNKPGPRRNPPGVVSSRPWNAEPSRELTAQMARTWCHTIRLSTCAGGRFGQSSIR